MDFVNIFFLGKNNNLELFSPELLSCTRMQHRTLRSDWSHSRKFSYSHVTCSQSTLFPTQRESTRYLFVFGSSARVLGPNMGLEAWYMDSSDDDQRKPHRLNPNVSVSLDELRKLGVFHWKLNADVYETDPELEQIRKEQGYSYMDIITIHKDTLPNYEEKVKVFYEEHLHLDDEIRYILDGQAYFDVRDEKDRWIRIAMEKGDLITLPAGIYHRFTLDETNYVKAMRLFVGEPVWKAYNRPADDFHIRQKYVASLQGS